MTGDLAEPLPGVTPGDHRRPALGYLLYLGAAVLFGINGTVSKFILLSGVESARLSQLRVTAAFVVLLAVVALTNRPALRLRRGELGLLVAYGVLGVAMTQWLYFVAIARLPVGVALLIEFTAPFMVALWVRFGLHQPVPGRVWGALVIALLGLSMVAQVWSGFVLDGLGVLAGFGAAAALAVYYLLGERGVHGPYPRDAVSLTLWGFGAAALFWFVVQPWWSFPWSTLATTVQPFGSGSSDIPVTWFVVWMVVLGTVVPFWLVVKSLHHLSASQASVVGMTEPVIASLVAWVLLGEVLTPVQLVGGFVVLGGVLLAERSR